VQQKLAFTTWRMSSGFDEPHGRGVEGSAAPCVFIALGSNLGDSPRIVLRAIDRLQDLSEERSSFLLFGEVIQPTARQDPPRS